MEMVKQLTPRTRASTEALCKPSSPPRLSISPPFVLSLSRIIYTRLVCGSPLVTRALTLPPPFFFILPFFRPSGFSLGKKDILRPSVFQALSL